MLFVTGKNAYVCFSGGEGRTEVDGINLSCTSVQLPNSKQAECYENWQGVSPTQHIHPAKSTMVLQRPLG